MSTLDAVLADPDDDAPRLVHADQLLERGDPLGELIIVQCTRERLEREGRRATEAYRTARRRENQLQAAWAKTWLAAVGLRLGGGRFARGFIDQVWLTMQALRTNGALLSPMPLEAITVRGPVELADIAWLVRQPFARSVRTVAIEASRGWLELDAAASRVLAANEATAEVWPPDGLPAPELSSSLRRLHVHHAEPRLAALLEARRAFDCLVELSFTSPDDAMTRVVATSSSLEHLEKLSVWLEPGRASTFIPALALGSLVDLALQGETRKSLGEDGPARLAASSVLATLTNLVADVVLDRPIAQALADCAVKLEVLALAGATSDGLAAFVASDLPRRLRWLTLRNTAPSIAAGELARAPFERLETLTLEGFTFDEASAAAFAAHPGLAALVDLKLTGCSFPSLRAAEIFASAPALDALIQPKVTHCGFDGERKRAFRMRWPDTIFAEPG